MKKNCLYLIGLFVVLFSGCNKTNELTEITIGTFSRAIDYSPFYVAKHFKWFENSEGLKGKKIIYKEYNDRETFATYLEKNELNAIFAAEPPIIITKAQGVDLKIVDVSCTLQQEIVIQGDLNINTPGDLVNHKLAVLAGTSSHYGLLKILSNNSVSLSDVNIKFMDTNEARIAFETKQIDGWAVWPPFVEEQQVKNHGKVLKGGDAIIQSVVAMPTETLSGYPEISHDILSVVKKAKEWIGHHPEEAITIVANELNLDIDVVKQAWPKHRWSATLNDQLIKDMQEKAVFLANEHATRNNVTVNIKDIVYVPIDNEN